MVDYYLIDQIENYEKKVAKLNEKLRCDMDEQTSLRLRTKRGVWRSVIVDLNRVLEMSEKAQNTEERAN